MTFFSVAEPRAATALLDLPCTNSTPEGKTLVPELGRPFNLLARASSWELGGMVEAAGIEDTAPTAHESSQVVVATMGYEQSGAEPDRPCCLQCCHDPADPQFGRVIGAWPDLPEHIRLAVLALIDAGTNSCLRGPVR